MISEQVLADIENYIKTEVEKKIDLITNYTISLIKDGLTDVTEITDKVVEDYQFIGDEIFEVAWDFLYSEIDKVVNFVFKNHKKAQTKAKTTIYIATATSRYSDNEQSMVRIVALGLTPKIAEDELDKQIEEMNIQRPLDISVNTWEAPDDSEEQPGETEESSG